jgi:hypothetical protein
MDRPFDKRLGPDDEMAHEDLIDGRGYRHRTRSQRDRWIEVSMRTQRECSSMNTSIDKSAHPVPWLSASVQSIARGIDVEGTEALIDGQAYRQPVSGLL